MSIHDTPFINRPPTFSTPKPVDVRLSSGRIITHLAEVDGTFSTFPTTGDDQMTDAEWREYCSLVKANNRQKLSIDNVAKNRNSFATQKSMSVRAHALAMAMLPFVQSYENAACHISDSDLDNEQPRSVSVTLGDCRLAARLLKEFAEIQA
jgi:hypothetical protein